MSTTELREQPARRWIVLAAALVAAGIVLRLAYPAYVAFGGEQVESIALAWKSWREGGADHGLRVSTGVDMPPFYLWLLSLPVAITRDPVRVTQFVMLLNVAGLAALFFVIRARRSITEAWLVTALCATAPWSIAFARKIWAQDVLFPFEIAFFAAFLSAVDRPAPWKTWAAFLALGVMTQIYPSAWFLVPPILVAAWLARLRIPWRDAAIGVVLVLVLWWPHIRYQFAVEFDDWKFTHALVFGHDSGIPTDGGKGPPRDLFHQLLGTWQRSGGTGLEALLGQGSFEDWQARPMARVSTILSFGFLAACAAATAWAVVILVKAVHARITSAPALSSTLILCAAIVVGVPLEYALLHQPSMPHYQIVAQPAVAILVVAGACELARRRGPAAAWFPFATIGAFALVHAAQSASLQGFVVDRPDIALEGNGPIYAGSRERMDRELEVFLEDVRTGPERRAAEDARRAELFARATDVLFQYSGVSGQPPLSPKGFALEPGPDGTRATLQALPAFVDLPELARMPERGQVIVRIDITSPIDAWLTLFFQTEEHRDYRRTQKSTQKLPRGRSHHFVLLDAAGLRGPFRLWLQQSRFTLHAIEVRAIDSGS